MHQYATRLAPKKSYYLPKVRTSYGKFNIRFSGAKLWNAITEDLNLNQKLSSPNIDWCTSYAANCVNSRCFVLHLCLFVCVFAYLLQLIYFFFVCLCVFVYL